MDRRSFTRGALAAGLLGGISGLGAMGARGQETHTLKVAHFWTANATPQQKLLMPWTQMLTERSGGRLQFQILPAMQIGGNPPQLIDFALDGVADIVWTMPGYTPGRFPAVEVFELPFMGSVGEASSRALWSFYETVPEVAAPFAGVQPLALHTTDRYVIHTKDRPVLTLDDFRGLKMRAPTRQTNNFLAAVGATPVSMPLASVPDAISKGTIDGCILPWEGVPNIKLHEIVKYHSETEATSRAFAMGTFMIAMNAPRLAALPEDLRQLILSNSGADLSAQIGRLWDESGEHARALALAEGNAINVIPAAETDSWSASLDALASKWSDEVKGAGLDGAALMASARDLVDKAEGR